MTCETCKAAEATHRVIFQSDHAGGMYGSRPELRCEDCVQRARECVAGTRATQVLASEIGAPEAPACWATRAEWDAFRTADVAWKARVRARALARTVLAELRETGVLLGTAIAEDVHAALAEVGASDYERALLRQRIRPFTSDWVVAHAATGAGEG